MSIFLKNSIIFSFLVPPDVYPGRIALLLTALLTLINLSINRPPSSGKIDRLQIWMVSCIGFVFASILNYALILFQVEMGCLGKRLCKFKVQNPRRNLLDNLALIIFPILFAIYSFCYFTINIKWLLIWYHKNETHQGWVHLKIAWHVKNMTEDFSQKALVWRLWYWMIR